MYVCRRAIISSLSIPCLLLSERRWNQPFTQNLTDGRFTFASRSALIIMIAKHTVVGGQRSAPQDVVRIVTLILIIQIYYAVRSITRNS